MTKVARPRPQKGDQKLLWDWADDRAITNTGQARQAVGDIAEDYLANVLEADRLTIEKGAICPDLRKDMIDIEVKTCGRGRGLTLFEHQVDRYRQLERDGHRIAYAICFHNVREPQSRHDLYRQFASTLSGIAIIPFSTIKRWCNPARIRRVKLHGRPELERAFRISASVSRSPLRLPYGYNRQRAFPTKVKRTTFGYIPAAVQRSLLDACAGDGFGSAYPAAIQDAARVLLFDLQHSGLDVALVPAPHQRHRNHCVRVAVGHNPDWYRELCADYQTGCHPRRAKHPDTMIKRHDVVSSLRTIAAGRRAGSIYESRLLPYLEAAAQ